MVSLAGVALIILGFFLPLLTQSNPQLPPTSAPHYPVSEWEAVRAFSGNPGLFTLLGFLAALPLLGMLIVLGISVAGLFRIPLPRLILLKCAAAAWGLAFQLLFNVLVIVFFSIGNARIDIGWGFVVVLIGFMVMLVGTLHLHMIFTPLACIFLAINSVILGWLSFGSHGRLSPIVIIVLPMLFLLTVLALLVAKQWVAAAVTLPIVMVTLYGLYFLMAFVIPGVPDVTFVLLLFLLLLNGGALWLTRRFQKPLPG